MNFRSVFHLISFMLIGLSIAIGISGVVSIACHDPESAVNGLLWSALIVLASGLLIWVFTRGPIDLSRKDGFGIVAFGWITASIFGALPYELSHTIPQPVDAIFETMSGFTTTGASVLTNLESVPRGILFWRSMTQWFGGMGVLVLVVAILPFLGVGGMQIYRAEMPGPSKDRLTPRITSTAKLLWGVYLALTVSEIILLVLCGMSWFDAANHAFATVSTGGFSTRTASISAYESVPIELVIGIFMFLSGINFSLHYRALRGKVGSYFRDPEFRFYLAICTVATLFLTFNTWRTVYPDFSTALRSGFFQSLTIITTTGFATQDFDLWPDASRTILLLLMFVGGCAGSTAGGMKVVRMFVVLKKTIREVKLFMLPRAVVQIKLGRKALDHDIVSNISAFFIIFILIFGVVTLLMSFFMPDMVSAASSVAATLGNIGPGLATVGPTMNFAAIPGPGKIILTFCMLLGRLELYTVLALFLPSFWKK